MIESRLRRCSHCSAKLVTSDLRPRVGQHPPHLLLEHVGLAELARARDVEQLVVGDAAPQEERQPRRQLEVADAVRRLRRDAGGILLDAEQELRTHQHGAQAPSRCPRRNPPSAPRPCGRTSSAAARSASVDRPPIGPAHQRREDLLRRSASSSSGDLSAGRRKCGGGWACRPAPSASYGPVIET